MEKISDVRSGQETAPESVADRIERMHTALAIRNARQADLLALLAQPDLAGSTLTDAWFKLQLAQGEFDQLVKAEILPRLDDRA